MQPSPAPTRFRLPRKPSAVVFDLDGTLIDSEALVHEGYMAAARHFRVALSDDQFLAMVGKHKEASNALLRSYFGADFPLDAFQLQVSAAIGDRAAPLKSGALELMAHLDGAGLPFALCTSSNINWVNRHFLAHSLGGRFRHIVTRADVTNGKPHPEPYLKAAAHLGHDPAAILALEDSATGLEAAHAAGMMAVLIPDLLHPTDLCRARAIHVAASLHDVVEMVAG